jgi:hypothetical protein
MGGNSDKSGRVEAEKLRKTIKAFELTINIDKLIRAPPSLRVTIRTVCEGPGWATAPGRIVEPLGRVGETDTDNSGFIDYDEFKTMLS